MRGAPYITLAEAAHSIGMKGKPRYAARRLKRSLLAKERKQKKQIMLRLNGPNGRTQFRVTLALLRKRCPELFDKRDEIAESLNAAIERLNDQIVELYKRDKALAEAIVGLKSQRGMPEVDRVGPRKTPI